MMKFARLAVSLAIVLLACAVNERHAAAEPAQLSPELLAEGWISLFDGETLFGWQTSGDVAWSVDDDTIATDGAQPGWLMTTTEWADYKLHVEFKAPATTNSGIFLRTPLVPTDPTKDCYELNIAPADNPYPTGTLVARAKLAGGNGGSLPNDDWHSFDVTARGGAIGVALDGKSVVEYEDPSPIRIGHIGLQAKEGPVAFRNLRLRPLGLKPLFNGKDLAGWTTAGAEQSKFAVTPAGELQLTNGPGQIATHEEFANFVLQLECKVDGDGLNSGVFFRTLRDGRWQGYESQINNRVHDGDAARPVDFGTGAIYRRQAARRVNASDREWFTKTIVADGPHIAVWVNGLQVIDWTDTRPPHENPREGLRLGPGVIAIQGHDPTTNFLFRDIEIAELPR
jgi:hypothetical protein